MTAEARLKVRWQKLCKDLADEARSQGAEKPFIFACESGLVVLDGPPFEEATQKPRQDAILFVLPWPSTIPCDAGGW